MAGMMFSEEAVKRIVESVRYTERLNVGKRPPPTRPDILVPFGLIRGTIVDSFTDADESFEIENVVALGESSPVPVEAASDKIRVANVPELSMTRPAGTDPGPTVYAVFSIQDVEDPGAGTAPITVYWEAIELGSVGIETILINGNVAGANYNSSTGDITPTAFTAQRYEEKEGGGYELGDTIDCENWFPDTIAVASGKGRIAKVGNGELLNVTCIEVDLPSGS